MSCNEPMIILERVINWMRSVQLGRTSMELQVSATGKTRKHHSRGRMLRIASALILTIAGASTPTRVNLQPAVRNVGTLICTVSDVPSGSTPTIDLSCNFRSQTGLHADYKGTARTRSGGFPPAKYVFVWSVVVLGAGLAPLLDGTFSAGPSQQGAAVLVGGSDGFVRLEPVPDNGQVPGPSEITRLTLKAAATRT